MKSNAKGLASWVMNEFEATILVSNRFKSILFKPSSRMYSRQQMRGLLLAHPFMWLEVFREKDLSF